MRLFAVLLTFTLVLTACGGQLAATELPTEEPAPTEVIAPESQEASIEGTFQSSLLVTKWKGGSEGTELFPLDPASGTALPDYTPISLGDTFSYAFSPDRQTLAVVTFPNQNTYNGSLLLIDLPAWETQRFELELSGWVSTMVFSPDGKQLAIAHGDTNYKLTMVNLEQGVIAARA